MDTVGAVALIILNLLMVVLGVFAVWVGIRRALRHHDVRRHFVATDAVVKSISKVEREPDGEGDIDVDICVTVEYIVDGRTLSADYKTVQPIGRSDKDWNLFPGEHVPILYYPDYPKAIEMDTRHESGIKANDIMLIIMGVGVILFAWSEITQVLHAQL